jgi:predicted secreted hydrolase
MALVKLPSFKWAFLAGVFRYIKREPLRGDLPGIVRQLLTFFASPKKVSKEKRPQDTALRVPKEIDGKAGNEITRPRDARCSDKFHFLSALPSISLAASQAEERQKPLRTHSQAKERSGPARSMFGITTLFVLMTALLLCSTVSFAAPPTLSQVTPDKSITFPHDFGAHPNYRTEWWYATGWLETPDKRPLGFQVTFFRLATDSDSANPSQFAPKQLIIAHAALSDPAVGKLLHDQRIAREGFNLAYAKEGNTDVKLDDWQFTRDPNGRYHAVVKARGFAFTLSMTPSQAPMLQGENGVSRKGPKPEQASYYYSEPQLQVTGTVMHNGKELKVNGSAWLDHEWSTSVLDPNAVGWDWVGANLNDGSALMAFQIRTKTGGKLWAHAVLRDASGRITQFKPDEVHFAPQRIWNSPHTKASYPVATRIQTGPIVWQLTPLQDDQELDSQQSTGSVYWEGAVSVSRDGKAAGRGYLELTGYVKPLKL